MALINEQRHRTIQRKVLAEPARVAEISAALWATLAQQLSGIIGERGFGTLYARSVHQASQTYPWLAAPASPLGAAPFTELQQRLQMRGMPESGEASIALLSIFIDTLTLLIGELVTTSILRAAWGDDTLSPAGSESHT
ncbi:hypothetical protein [Duganella sp. BuS-21]|uniref:hypothetical protein n=1 Tax=Duganella sp. BuS-21 TaxID=2943848 RepID=UPI0035A73C5E